MNAIRSIPIPSEIVDALREHIGGRTEGFVFTTKDGSQWNVDLVLKKNLRETLKVTRGHLHMFRHRFAARRLTLACQLVLFPRSLDMAAFHPPSTSQRGYWLNTWNSLSVRMPNSGHLSGT